MEVYAYQPCVEGKGWNEIHYRTWNPYFISLCDLTCFIFTLFQTFVNLNILILIAVGLSLFFIIILVFVSSPSGLVFSIYDINIYWLEEFFKCWRCSSVVGERMKYNDLIKIDVAAGAVFLSSCATFCQPLEYRRNVA